MRLINLIVVAIFATYSFANAQIVKKQFQDNGNRETTVVVKEDAANDYDVLNSQFNIDDVGMGTVIRIDTETELPAPSTAEMVANVSEDTPLEIEKTSKVVTQDTNEAVDRASEPVAKKVVKKAPSRSSSSKSYKKSKKRSSKKFKVKKKKRKRYSKRKKFNSCYRF